MSEQRDFVRAIVALQQQQQQQEHGPRLELRGKNPDGILPSQQVVSGVTSPRRSSAADRNPSVDVVQLTENPPMPVNASQPRASPAHPRASVYEPTSFPTATSIGQDMIVNFSTLSSILPGQDRSGEMSISSVPRGSFGASNAPSHTMDSVNNYQMYDGFSSVGTSARSISDRPGDGISAQNIDTELTLFLLKPVVKDFFDKVELSWSVQNTRMQPQAIRKQMADHEQEGMPSVLEMLHNLHAYEQAMVDLEISKYPEGSVLSLKRTKTDIQHRDMTFKAIPGLQFVVQHVIRSYACQEEQLANTLAQAPVITDPALHSALHIDLQQAQVAPHQQLQQMMQMAPQQQNLAAPPQQREGQWEEQQWDQQPRPLRRSKRTLNPRRSSPSFTQDDALAQYTIHHSTAGLPQPPATDPPMLQPQQQPQSYFTQDDPSAPHYTQAPYSFGPAPPPQQQLLAPQPQPPPPPPARQASLHRPRKRKAPVPARQASLPPSRKRKAPGSAPLVAMPPISSPRGPSTSIREQVLAFQHPPQSQQDDAGEAVSGVARRSAIGFLKKRKQKQDVVALPSSESKSEKEYEASDASDFDGSEGDDVDVDAIVKELLKKYTTLFD